ncbi:hypothetical protein BO70DRAFT_59160 [Aspergillus heteromorphus CBS 117.55]|uniref:Uncharacterized protein n=1 Tax=Aspergillus heteromorphus CBS 117.55 TaxID=1448321 RepID=A0A317VYI4_9EURO|nr:uncharacterized protein BO70DRAFT_59160 [Aspergillus heteromorphus CBS 117.55]PWY79333.1 hypothetical protein BO70DRAFT_59160 [Aspergillus heteromorphus CBS 117.55]
MSRRAWTRLKFPAESFRAQVPWNVQEQAVCSTIAFLGCRLTTLEKYTCYYSWSYAGRVCFWLLASMVMAFFRQSSYDVDARRRRVVSYFC